MFKNKIMKKDPIVVYWAPHANIQNEHNQILLDIKPVSLMSEIQHRRAINPKIPNPAFSDPTPGQYQSCSALHTIAENMFVIKAPLSVDISLTDSGEVIRNSKDAIWFNERVSSIENTFSVDYGVGITLFCEEELEVSLTPPYMHKTPNFGFVAAVKFDISRWFRPFIVIYQLWEGEKRVHLEEGEPVAYLKFHTERKIIFKEFALTERINNQALSCLQYKLYKPHKTMAYLYDLFMKTNMRSRVAKEIKANLIE